MPPILIYDIFIYCNWVSTQWQWYLILYKNRKDTAIYKWRNNIENKHKKNIKKHKSSNKKITKRGK
jgi:hypothetical protein